MRMSSIIHTIGLIWWVITLVVRLAATIIFVYYTLFDREALLAWAAEWWEVIVAFAGVLFLLPKVEAKFNFDA